MEKDQVLEVFTSKMDLEYEEYVNVYNRILDTTKLPATAPLDSVMASICELTLRSALLDGKEERLKELQAKNQLIESRLESLKAEWRSLQPNLRSVKDQNNQMTERTIYYADKFKAFYRDIRQLEEELAHRGFNAALTEESLEKLHNKNKELFQELAFVKEKLEEYDFEPDEDSLVTKIKEMKKHIRDYDKYFNRDSI